MRHEHSKPDLLHWISLLAMAIALHGYHKGFPTIYPGDVVALAVVGLILVYCVGSKRQLPGQEKPGQRLALRLAKRCAALSGPANASYVPPARINSASRLAFLFVIRSESIFAPAPTVGAAAFAG